MPPDIDFGNDHFHNRVMKPSTHSSNLPNPRGRPREFDMDDALDKAIPLFCARGFHGASINDIAEAMELTVGSIYKAFKDKRGVFLAAIDRQLSLRQIALRDTIAAQKSGRDKLRAALMFYAGVTNCGEDIQQGCLIVSTTVELATFDDEIANRAKDSFKRREVIIADLLKTGEADGSIAASSNNAATARMMLCLMQGLIVIGKAGRTRKELMAVVDAAMKTLD